MSNHELLKTLSGYVAASSSAASSLMRAELLEQADAKLDKKGEAAAQRAAAEKAEDVAVAAAKARWAFKQEDKVVTRDGGESKYREVIGDAKLLKQAAEAEANELEAAAAAAETAVRWWLEVRAPLVAPPPEHLTIVTGWGKSRRASQDSDVRGRVECVLADMGVPTLPSDNPGCVVVDARKWSSLATPSL